MLPDRGHLVFAAPIVRHARLAPIPVLASVMDRGIVPTCKRSPWRKRSGSFSSWCGTFLARVSCSPQMPTNPSPDLRRSARRRRSATSNPSPSDRCSGRFHLRQMMLWGKCSARGNDRGRHYLSRSARVGRIAGAQGGSRNPPARDSSAENSRSPSPRKSSLSSCRHGPAALSNASDDGRS